MPKHPVYGYESRKGKERQPFDLNIGSSRLSPESQLIFGETGTFPGEIPSDTPYERAKMDRAFGRTVLDPSAQIEAWETLETRHRLNEEYRDKARETAREHRKRKPTVKEQLKGLE